MNITKNVNGYWIISDIIDGYRVNKTYIGYTKIEAIRQFNQENKPKHNPEYDKIVPNEIFDIEDSNEVAELYLEMFGV